MNDSDKMNIRFNSNIYLSPVTDDGCVILDFAHDKILSINKSGAGILHKISSQTSGISTNHLYDQLISSSSVDQLITRLVERKILLYTSEPTIENKIWLTSNLTRIIVGLTGILIKVFLILKLSRLAGLIVLMMVDIVLKLNGINSLRKIVTDWQVTDSEWDDSMIEQICSAMTRACIWYPKQSLCLQRSSAITCLLRAKGVPAEMVIGVRKMPFYGHAWVEVNGKVVNDNPKVQTFFSACN